MAGMANSEPSALPSDLAPEAAAVPAGPAARAAYLRGSAGLLVATASDAIAVAGRHLGFRLIGSIELVQAAVVLLASAAMLAVTIGRGHASVHMVTSRLGPRARVRLARAAALGSAAVFLLLAAGSAWIVAELWSGHEQTELLHLPLRWLRLLWVVFAFLVAVEFIRSAGRASG
jgi:TRAP-type C4-dicarboxylate transport system permease small subunit